AGRERERGVCADREPRAAIAQPERAERGGGETGEGEGCPGRAGVRPESPRDAGHRADRELRLNRSTRAERAQHEAAQEELVARGARRARREAHEERREPEGAEIE